MKEKELERLTKLKEYEDKLYKEGISKIAGIDEAGRNKIEEIYAKVFKAEDALVRAQFISGTHALAITLSALIWLCTM